MGNEEETPPAKNNQKTPTQRLQQADDFQEGGNDSMQAIGSGGRSGAQPQGTTQAHPLATRTRGSAITGRGTKRGAVAQGTRAGAGKKQKTLVLRDESGSDEDSDDELKFKFKKR